MPGFAALNNASPLVSQGATKLQALNRRLDREPGANGRGRLQLVFSPSLELEPAAGDEILDGLRDEHLGWAGLGGYSRADR